MSLVATNPKNVILTPRQLCELEMILDGSYNPVTTYMSQADYESVCQNLELTNGEFFPLPINLDLTQSQLTKLNVTVGDTLTLMNDENLPLASLEVGEIYQPDLNQECEKTLGTTDTNHPYAKTLLERTESTYYLAGKLTQVNAFQHSDFSAWRRTPAETRELIKQHGWEQVVGFQTRNPMHRCHYEVTLQLTREVAAASASASANSGGGVNHASTGLLLTPTVGVTQECDIDYYTRVKCYIQLVKRYPEEFSADLCLLPLAMRMAGPREALLHAVVRRNYGCTHFIIGRDHAGPSYKPSDGRASFYGPYEAHELARKYESRLGIKTLFMQMMSYVSNIDSYLPDNQITKEQQVFVKNISGTQFREMLLSGETIPEWFSFPETVQTLKDHLRTPREEGFCIYTMGLSGGGKTTLVKRLKDRLMEHNLYKRNITILDADIIRQNLSKGLGFSREDRSTNVQRIGYVASEIVKHGGIVLVANIAPYRDDREINRVAISKEGHYYGVYVDTSLETCKARDCKGLYALAEKGEIKMTGVNDPYEVPDSSECQFIFQSENHQSLDNEVNLILKTLIDANLIS